MDDLLRYRELGNSSYLKIIETSERVILEREEREVTKKESIEIHVEGARMARLSFSEALRKLCEYRSTLKPINKSVVKEVIKSVNDEIIKDSETCAAAQRLVDYGLVETMLQIIVQDFMNARNRRTSHFERNKPYPLLKCDTDDIGTVTNIINTVLECLKQCPNVEILHLVTDYELIEALFSLITNHNIPPRYGNIRDTIVSVLDLVLASEQDAPPVDLRKINGLSEMLKDYKGSQDTHLFHVLSAILSASEFNAIAHSSLEKYDQWMVESGFAAVMESNHRFFLDQDKWLEHMCALVCRTMQQVVDDPDSITQLFSRMDIQENDLSSFTQHHFSDRDGLFYQLLLYKEKALRGDVFLLLSLLLSGKFREEVQNRLVASKCMSKLPAVFKEVVWINFQGHASLLIEGSGSSRDECCLDMFVRIQFLRFVYSIADNHRNRYLLLSLHDVNRLQQLAEERSLAYPEGLREMVTQQLFVSEEGLLMRLISALRQEPPSSCVRFWITRALEAFLRGETIALNQALLLEQRLVEDTFSLIISGAVQNEMVLQGSFDFLCTLMKFNIQAFERCNNVLDCTDKIRKLIKLTADNLVDSNMFLRCIILTAAHIKDKLPDKLNFLENCRLLKYFSDIDEQVDFAVKLNRLLTVSTLSQENVSCLNTSLLIMILAHRRDKLSTYLRRISDMDDGVKLLKNMKHLLNFWFTHYTLPIKQADCKSLETSTAINFDEWKLVVSKLLSADATQIESIQHYLNKLHITPNGRRIAPQPTMAGRLS